MFIISVRGINSIFIAFEVSLYNNAHAPLIAHPSKHTYYVCYKNVDAHEKPYCNKKTGNYSSIHYF